MELFVYAVVGLSVTWLLYFAYVQVATRSAEGRSAKPLFDIFPETAGNGKTLVYCFSPQCGPCRPMSKEVDLLIDSGIPVFKLDITRHPQAGHELGIRAIPTLILIEHGSIARMVLGVKMADFMRNLLDDTE